MRNIGIILKVGIDERRPVIAKRTEESPVLETDSLFSIVDKHALLWGHQADWDLVSIHIDIGVSLELQVYPAVAEVQADVLICRIQLATSGSAIDNCPAGRIPAKNCVMIRASVFQVS